MCHPRSRFGLRSTCFALLAVTALSATACTSAEASAPPPHPKILLHVRPLTNRNECAWGTLTNCASASTAGQLANGLQGPYYYVYLMVDPGGLASVSGMQLGISYNGAAGQGVDIFGWHACVGFEAQSLGWPNSGSGDVLVWNSNGSPCATAAVPVAGYFYLGSYSPDQLQVVVRPTDHLAKVSDCTSTAYTLGASDLGSVNFTADGLTPGYNPCSAPIPTMPITWGGIKALHALQ